MKFILDSRDRESSGSINSFTVILDQPLRDVSEFRLKFCSLTAVDAEPYYLLKVRELQGNDVISKNTSDSAQYVIPLDQPAASAVYLRAGESFQSSTKASVNNINRLQISVHKRGGQQPTLVNEWWALFEIV